MKYAKPALRIFLLFLVLVAGLAVAFPDRVESVSTAFIHMSEQRRFEREQAESNLLAKYPIPKDRQLTISGTISDKPFDLDITYTVVYTAREDKRGCHSLNMFVGKDPHVKWYTYQSKITGNTHSVDLPLNEHPAYEGCHYQPSTVSIGISRAGNEANLTDDLFSDQKHYSSITGPGYPTSAVHDNRLTVECRQPVINGKVYDSNWSCRQNSGDGSFPLLIQQLNPHNHDDVWNIDIGFISEAESIASQLLADRRHVARSNVDDMARLVGGYYAAVREPLRSKSAAELLAVIQGKADMSAYEGTPFIDTYNERLAEVKRDVPFEDGTPVDPWGRPYQYSVRKVHPDWAPRPELYSLGADGVESDDDIGSWEQ